MRHNNNISIELLSLNLYLIVHKISDKNKYETMSTIAAPSSVQKNNCLLH